MATTPTKHTPGPWKWDGHALSPAVRDPQQHALHTIMLVENFAYGFVGTEYNAVAQEDDANRDLIAAAPELLKAAQLVYDEMSIKGEISAITWGLLAAAINKATGAA